MKLTRFLSLLLMLISCFSSKAQTVVFFEDFQGGIPANFTLIDNDGNTPALAVAEFTSAWIALADPENLSDTVAASTSFFTPQDTASRWLISPPIPLGSFGNYFSWEARSHDPSFPDDYLVLVSTTDNLLSSFTDTIGFVIEENFEWASREVDLSEEGYDNQTIYIAFVQKTYDGFKLYLNDLEARKEDVTKLTSPKPLTALNCYPNPSKDNVNFSSNQVIEAITIYSGTGQFMLNSNQTAIDIRQFNPGIYYARVNCNNEIITLKFIKE